MRASPSIAGVGIGLRRAHFEALEQLDPQRLDWLEFVPENFVGRGGVYARALAACRERWPLVPHGVSLSIGGPDSLETPYLAGLRRLLHSLGVAYYSDHLCYCSIEREQFYDLLPLPWSDAAADYAGARGAWLQDHLQLPVALEHVTTYGRMPGSHLTEGDFVARALASGGLGLVLDVNNVYLDAVNHGHDPWTLLASLPLERVRHVHLAGHRRDGRFLLDSHDGPVAEPVWALYEQLLTQIGPVPTLIEWDAQIPALEVVLQEVERARASLARAAAMAPTWSIRAEDPPLARTAGRGGSGPA
jgi:uncharacterized protein (UPF0276 family)